MEKQKKVDDKLNMLLKILFIVSCLLFAVPSICYYFEMGTILEFDRYYQFLLNKTDIKIQTVWYLIILSIITITYYVIIKKRNKIFRDFKSIMIFVTIVSLIFVIVIPFISSDIFYYLGIGRIDGEYGQNPYYVTIKQFVEDTNNSNYLNEDTVLKQGYLNVWSDTTVVYGPIWTLICRMVATMSFGNIDIGLAIFKLVNVLVHLCNCYLFYKISNKKIFSLLYGINPFILIEGIAHVHNDIFVILFTLLAFYYLLKKKNLIVSIIFIALATAIKYFTILLLPFIIIYYFKEEKPSKRLLQCIKYGLVFLGVLLGCYLIYIQDLSVFNGLIVQNEKLAKGIYIIILDYFNDIPDVIENTKTIMLGSFAIIYFFACIIILNKKEIKFNKEIKTANYFIVAFLFLLITNFQPWYIMWLFPCLIWQKADVIKLTIGMSILSQFVNSIFLMYEENWHYGTPFIFILIVGTLATYIFNQNKRKERIKQGYLRRKKIG